MDKSANSKKNIYIILGSLIALFIILVFLLKSPSNNNSKTEEAIDTNQTAYTNQTDTNQTQSTEAINQPTSNNTQPENLTNKPQPTIKITDKGFEPRDLTIKTGETIVFVNNDSQDHWPASDPHPTHSILPEFDAKKPLKSGETFKFKFEQAGRWPCHDHLNPSLRCLIVVE